MYKQQSDADLTTINRVRAEYKRYKRKQPPPDLSEVIDPLNPEQYADKLRRVTIPPNQYASTCERYCKVGLKHPKQWQVFEVSSSPGFLVVPNPFVSAGAQSHWTKQSLTTYTKEPYPCNLDVLMKLDKSRTMWELSAEKSPDDNSFINQFRWVHMGYHFDYNTVDYKLKNYHGFPEDLALLAQTIAHVFGYTDYVPETGIINYYPEGATMGGHTDHYEDELSQPLIAYTFGQSAVYLIGGQTRDVKPEAVWVRSGDVMLMTGESRTAFHAVPRIVTRPMRTAPLDIGSCSLVVDSDAGGDINSGSGGKNCGSDTGVGGGDGGCGGSDDSDECTCSESDRCWTNEMLSPSWGEFSKYLSNTRININIRQVHKYRPELKTSKSPDNEDIIER